MKVHTHVTFEPEDISEILKSEYVKKFGPPPVGYELTARDRYGEWVVEMVEVVKKEEGLD